MQFNGLIQLFGIIAIGVISLVVIMSGFRITREWERLVVLRFGKFHRIAGPGIFYVIPFLEKDVQRVSLRVREIKYEKYKLITRDSQEIIVKGVVRYRVVDVEKAILSVERFHIAVQVLFEMVIKEVVKERAYDTLLADRLSFCEEVMKRAVPRSEPHWGVKITEVDLSFDTMFRI